MSVLRRKGVGNAFLPAFLVILHLFLLFLLLFLLLYLLSLVFLLEQVVIDAHAFEVYAKVKMMTTKLMFAKVKSHAKIFVGCRSTASWKYFKDLNSSTANFLE